MEVPSWVRRFAVLVVAVAALAGCAGEGVDVGDAPAVPADAGTTEATEAAEPSPSKSADPKDAVKIVKCGRNDFGAYWKGTLKNTSTERSDYFISAEIVDAKGDRVDDAGTMATKVRPGQSVKLDAVGLGDVKDLPKKFSCRLISVDRVPSTD